MSIVIRDMVPQDMPVLEQLMCRGFDPLYGEAWSPQDLASTLNLPNIRPRLSCLGASVSGFCITYLLPDAAELLLVAVEQDLRRQGIARRLVADASDLARHEGLSSLFLEVREDNKPARSLYDSLGFSVIGRRAGYYKGKDKVLRDAVTLRLPLL
jgi:[ribosomal protein S18]-alanine N-acetyltransferase